jgi:hypothetical protein
MYKVSFAFNITYQFCVLSTVVLNSMYFVEFEILTEGTNFVEKHVYRRTTLRTRPSLLRALCAVDNNVSFPRAFSNGCSVTNGF